jgi:hypothetical protein
VETVQGHTQIGAAAMIFILYKDANIFTPRPPRENMVLSYNKDDW